MAEVGIRALKQNASEVIARVAAGESIVVTDRSRPAARLVPLGLDRIAALVEEGALRPARGDLRALAAPGPGPVLSAALLTARGEERY